MTANEFDELVARLTSGASRRDAVRGIVGGAITSVGVATLTAKGRGKGKGKKKGKQATNETNAVGHGKRIFCFCPDDDPSNCRTRRAKTKKFKKLFRKHPESQRGPCEDTTTTTTPTPTTQEPTTTLPPTTQEPTTTLPPTTQPPGTTTTTLEPPS